ncbi:MAG: copper resistance protein NlpE N-terminal domain-containing protein [Flavisolibacter sp.]
MRIALYLLLIFFSACTLPAERKQTLTRGDSITIESNDTHAALEHQEEEIPKLIKKEVVKKPSGIYQTRLAYKGGILHTIAFHNDGSYQLQEKYITAKKDSVVITRGNWSPSDGYIWLYKDQVVNGRYRWKGDSLQYFSPLTKESFSMQSLTDANENAAWRKRAELGVSIVGIGNEPFWNIEVMRQDSISITMPEWKQPLILKISTASSSADSIAYVAKNDSTNLRVTLFPFFCSDGMSDYVYSNKMRVWFNDKVYEGCGVVYK